MSEKSNRGKSSFSEIEIGLNGLLGAIGDAVHELARRAGEGGAGELRHVYEIDTQNGPLRAEAGIRIRTAGTDGLAPGDHARKSPVKRSARHASSERERTSVSSSPVRRVAYDILETDEDWRLTADLPGVDEKEITLTDTATGILLETKGRRKYRAEFPVPEGISAARLARRMSNGILELTARPEEPQ